LQPCQCAAQWTEERQAAGHGIALQVKICRERLHRGAIDLE